MVKKKGYWEKCERCHGEGTHLHESAREMPDDADHETTEAYYDGTYDVTCEICSGAGKIHRDGDAPKADYYLQCLKCDTVFGDHEAMKEEYQEYAGASFQTDLVCPVCGSGRIDEVDEEEYKTGIQYNPYLEVEQC